MEKVEKGRKNEKIILAILIVAIILISQIAIIMAKNGVFNNNGEKLISLLTEKQYASSVLRKNIENFSGDGEKSYKFVYKGSELARIENFFGMSRHKALNSSIEVNGTVVTENNDYDVKMLLNNQIASEIIQNGSKTAISIPKLYKKYIVLENSNIESEIRKILDIESNENVKQEMSRINKKYTKLLASSIKDNVKTKNNEKIEIDGNDYSTKKYMLKLENGKFVEILKKILKELKDDDETIKFITNRIDENNKIKKEYSNAKSNTGTNIDLKKEIENMYENLNVENIELEINVYEYKNKNIMSEITLNQNGKEYFISFETEPTDGKDNSMLTLKKKDEIIQCKFDGNSKNDLYNAKILVNSKNVLADLNVEKYKSPTRQVRKIEELDKIEISKASDEELRKLRQEIKNNLKVQPKDNIGRFQIEKPKTSGDAIVNAALAYKRINPIMTKDEIIRILGEPNEITSGEKETEEYLSWYQDEKIKLITVKVEGIKLYEVVNDIAQDEKYNNEIYKSLSGDVEDISKIVNQIKNGDTRESVNKVLGDKNIEVLKSNLGYKEYMWYDKNGKSEKIRFDENDKVIK